MDLALSRFIKLDIRNARYWPHALNAMRRAYVNWPHVVVSLLINDVAVGKARDGSSWQSDHLGLFSYAKLVAYAGCRASAAAQDYIELQCDDGYSSKMRIYVPRHSGPSNTTADRYSGLLDMIADYKSILSSDVKDKSVLDVGAFVGDSAILFALMGARRVVAVEPLPLAYQVARKNVEANSLSDVITLVNCVVSREDGKTLMMPSSELYGGVFRTTVDVRGDTPVSTCTLDSLIDRYGPFDVMKMDCEGCEHESIPYSRRVSSLEVVFLEYHDGYEDVARKLKEDGFEVLFSGSLVAPKLYKSAVSSKQGYIYASKKSV